MRRAILLLLLAVVLAVPIALMTAQGAQPLSQAGETLTPISRFATLTPDSPQEVDPLDLTASAIVQQVTDTGATACAINHCTPTPFSTLSSEQINATQTFIADEETYSAELDITATYVIGRATQYAAIQLTGTACALGLCEDTPSAQGAAIDPLDMSATYVIGQATDDANARLTETACALGLCAPTLAPNETLTPPTPTLDFAPIQQTYLNDLVSAVGFRYPTFDKITNEFALAQEDPTCRRSVDPRFNHLPIDVSMTWFAGSKYVALIVHAWPMCSESYRDELMVFQITDNVPTLLNLPTTRALDSNSLILYFDTGEYGVGNRGPFTNYTGGFADRNDNNLPDLAIDGSCGGNNCMPILALFEIQNDGSLKDITPATNDIYQRDFEDINHDGAWEIIGLAEEFISGSPPVYIDHLYSWNGTAYVEVSSQHPEFYLPEIQLFLNRLNRQSACYRPDDQLFRVLLDYQAMGQLKEGWKDLYPRLGWDACSPDQLASFGENIGRFEQWVSDHS